MNAVPDLSFSNLYTLTYEQVQHLWNILNGYPQPDLKSMRKMAKVYDVLRPHVQALKAYGLTLAPPVNLAKEQLEDLKKNPASTAEQRIAAENAFIAANDAAKAQLDEFKNKTVSLNFMDREAISYAKTLYAQFIKMGYSETADGKVDGYGKESDARLFDEVATALKIVTPD